METNQPQESQEQDQQQSTQQNQSEIKLVPYVQIDDEWILSEVFLDSIFDKIINQGLLKTIFWEENVTDESHFVNLARSPNNHMVFFFEAGKGHQLPPLFIGLAEKKKPSHYCVGFAWVSAVTSNYAFAHFCLFKEVWGRSDEIGKNCVDYWFSWPGTEGPLLDVLIGIMPGFNRRAHKFIERLGFTRLGVVPGMFRDKKRNRDDAVIYYMSR